MFPLITPPSRQPWRRPRRVTTSRSILVDGLALNDAESGMFDLSRLPLARYERADVYRGLVPVMMGGVAGAGAVNLVTAAGAQGFQVGGKVGSFGERSSKLVWGTGTPGTEGGDMTVTAHARRIENDYDYTDRSKSRCWGTASRVVAGKPSRRRWNSARGRTRRAGCSRRWPGCRCRGRRSGVPGRHG